MVTCWSVGSLCDLHMPYAPLNKTNHGFAILTKNKKEFGVENRRINKGRVML